MIHLPARVREALGGIAAARGVSVEALVERVLENAVAAEARWRRYPQVDPRGRSPDGPHPRRRADDRGNGPDHSWVGPAGESEPRPDER